MSYSREEMRAYMQVYRQRRTTEARMRLGGRCVRCGSTEDLHFDHTDPAGKVKAISQLLHASRARFEAELAKCQLLCGDCHRAKTRQGRELGQKLTMDQARELRSKAAAGTGQRALSREYGLSLRTVQYVLNGKTYKEVP